MRTYLSLALIISLTACGDDATPVDLGTDAAVDMSTSDQGADQGVDSAQDQAVDQVVDQVVDLEPDMAFDLAPVDDAGMSVMTATVQNLAGIALDAVTVENDADSQMSTTTNSSGMFSLALPANAPIYVKATKTGFLDTLLGIQLPLPFSNFLFVLADDATATFVGNQLSKPYNASKGTIIFSQLPVGATITLSGSPNEGAFVLTSVNFPQDSNTIPSGGSVGGFWNVDPGTVTLTVGGTGTNCTAQMGASSFEVRANTLTTIPMVCP